MNQKAPSHKAFLKMLSRAYDDAGLPLAQNPISAFILNATHQGHSVIKEGFADTAFTKKGLVLGKGVSSAFTPLTPEAILLLTTLEQLYKDDVSITASLIVRLIHAGKTRVGDEPLRDKKHIISFTPSCVETIKTYINNIELRHTLEVNFTGLSGSILEYSSKQNADIYSDLLERATVYNYQSVSYLATELRPSQGKALRHLTNYLYYTLFWHHYADGYLDKTFIVQSEVFVRDMLAFHLNRLPFLYSSY